MRKLLFIIIIVIAGFYGCTPSADQRSVSSDYAHKVDSLLLLMTLDEKLGQLTCQQQGILRPARLPIQILRKASGRPGSEVFSISKQLQRSAMYSV
jgi:hypothetical protein